MDYDTQKNEVKNKIKQNQINLFIACKRSKTQWLRAEKLFSICLADINKRKQTETSGGMIGL